MLPEFMETNKQYLAILADACGRFYVLIGDYPFYLKPELHFVKLNEDVKHWLETNLYSNEVFSFEGGLKIQNKLLLEYILPVIVEQGKFKKKSAEALTMLLKLDTSIPSQRVLALQISEAINKVYWEESSCKLD